MRDLRRFIFVVGAAAILQMLLLFAPLVCVGRFHRLWQDPALSTLAGLATALLLGDALTMLVGAGDQPSRTAADRKHARLALATGITLLLTIWISILDRGLQSDYRFGYFQLVAATMAVLGVVLRCVAILSLRSNFVTSISACNRRRLLTSGIYRRVRHPSEVGLLLFVFGIVALLNSKVALVASLPLVALIGWRTRLEECELEIEFGARFRRYARRVGAFVPRVVLTWRTESHAFKHKARRSRSGSLVVTGQAS
jgi:protein-S-isoprenylcysteine O-methyltransferase Ste14